MGLADLHIHTIYSWDGTSTVSAVLKKAQQLNLQVIAITDHDEIMGGYEALQLAPYYGVEVILASEVSTSQGHLLALFIKSKIPKGLSLLDTLEHIGEQGGLAIVAHPANRMINSLSPKVVESALQHPIAQSVLVGVEVFNAGLVHTHSNRTALRIASRHSLAKTGNSDSHLLWMVGMGRTVFPGNSAEDLRQALLARQTEVVRKKGLQKAILVPHWIVRYFLRKAGWVSWNPSPNLPVRFSRVLKANP